MAKEIERKYLVNLATWVPQGEGIHFKQGYLNSQKERVVRVRIEGAKAKLTIKGITTGVTRAEFEYLIPVADAAILLDNLCEQPLIDKHRHKEIHGGKTWEILPDSPAWAITSQLVLDRQTPEYLYGQSDVGPWRYALLPEAADSN